MREHRNVRWIIIALLLFLVILGIYNGFFNKQFLEMPIYHLLSLFFALAFAFYFSNKFNDDRRLKEIVVSILCKIQDATLAEYLYKFSNPIQKNEKQNMLMKKRYLENKIAALEKVCKRLNFDEKLEYIKQRFKEYDDLVGEHMDDGSGLSAIELQLRKQLSLIEDKCDEIIIDLHI